MRITKQDRLLMYIGSSKKDSEKLPEAVGEVFLTALKMALKGEPMKMQNRLNIREAAFLKL